MEASKIFEIAANTEGSKNQVTDTYYFGLSSYFASANMLANGEAKNEDLIRRADAAFAFVIDKAPELLEPYLYRARNQSLLDDRDAPTGIATPYYEKYIEMVKSKGDAEVQKSRANLIEIYNTLAYQYVQQENFDKAEELLTETVKLDPENAYAKDVLTYIEQVKAFNNPTGR